MATNPYPTNCGWNRATMTLYTEAPADVEAAKKLVSGGELADYEFPVVEQRGKKLKIIYRKLPAAVKRDDLKVMTAICRRANNRELIPGGVTVIWQKEENHFRLEAWHDSTNIASVRIHQMHAYGEEEAYIAEDLCELAKNAWTHLYPPATTE